MDNNKHYQIQCWLKEVFTEESVPEFEFNHDTVEYLYNLCQHNKQMNDLAKLTIDDLNHKNDEYKQEGARLHEILEGVGLPTYTLSNAGKANLKMLTDLATTLNIKDVKNSSYCLALNDFTEDLSNNMKLLAEKQDDINALITQTSDQIEKLEKMKSFNEKVGEYSVVDASIAEKRRKDTIELRSKSQRYEGQIIEYEKDALQNPVDKSIHHETLLQLSKELNELKRELKPLLSRFKSYRSLPPDINLAKVKIEEAKRQLKMLETELQTDIDILRL